VTSQDDPRHLSSRAPDDITTGAPRPSVTIVLPAYNEALRIEPALAELLGYLHRGGPARSGGRSSVELGRWDVLVVDDGSTDDTVSIVESFPDATAGAGDEPRLRVLRCPHRGKGGAVTAGMLAATGDLVFFADADMATPPDQLPLLSAALADHDLALGSRVQPDGKDRRASQPLHRRVLGRVYRLLAGAWVTGSVPDTQCGFKGFRREVGRDLFGRLRTTGIVFDAEVIHLARRRGYSMAIVPVMWHDVRGSRMRVRPSLAMAVLWDLLRIPFLHRDVRPAEQHRGPHPVAPAIATPRGRPRDDG
jgi:glycosyltransferase involved in cell wall biosynthesis